MRVALAGNPNSGKSTLFNALTGANAHVGNYPGITVERKEAELLLGSGGKARILDLPGCYSLTSRSRDEHVAQSVLMGSLGDPVPDVIICVVDATSIRRGLYLVMQLLELGIPLVVAVNMMDAAEKEGLTIDHAKLESHLGVPVVPITARSGEGAAELRSAIVKARISGVDVKAVHSDADKAIIERMCQLLSKHGSPSSMGSAIWFLTSNPDHLGEMETELSEQIEKYRTEIHVEPLDGDDGFNRRIILGRYRLLDDVLGGVVQRAQVEKKALSDKVDDVLLHPILGLGIFCLAMLLLFQAVFTWAEPFMGLVEGGMALVGGAIEGMLPPGLLRSLLVDGVVAGLGNVLVFLPQIAFLFLGVTILEESGYMARAAFLLDRLMRRVGLHGKAFVPLMSGFACAVPGVMAARTVESNRDRLVTIFVLPFMSCAARLPVYVLVISAVFSSVPPIFGIISVGGLVISGMYFLGFVVAIFTAWLLKRSVLGAPAPPLLLELPAYRMPAIKTVWRLVYERCRVFVVQTGSIILAISILLWAALTFPILDEPALVEQVSHIDNSHMDTSAAATQMQPLAVDKVAPDMGAVGVATKDETFEARQLKHSIGGRLGQMIEPLIEPLGFDWRIGIGLIASFAAREVLVSTLGQVYALGSDVDAESMALRDAILADVHPKTGKPRFSPLVGMSLMVFFVLAMQCMSTMATVRRETNSWRWPVAQLVYMNGVAYLASLLVYQGGILLGYS